jgi:hypothetical protein
MDLKCVKSKKVISDLEEGEFQGSLFENKMEDLLEDIEVAPDDLLKDHEYLQETKPQEEWDCETILTSASTWDNRPKIIKSMGKNSRGLKRSVDRLNTRVGIPVMTSSAVDRKIILQGKLQLPEDPKNNRTVKLKQKDTSAEDNSDDLFTDDGKNVMETKEEKKIRKTKVKEDKRNLRIQKKQLKLAFTGESTKIVTDQSTDHISIFKYSN